MDIHSSPIDAPTIAASIGESISVVEKRFVLATLEHCKGSKSKAAKCLGVCVKTLYNKLASYRRAAQ